MDIGSFHVLPIDIFFTIVILFMTIKAIVRGFVTEFMSLAAVGLGIILGALLSGPLGEFISQKFGHTNWNQVIAFLLIFLVTYILTKIFENGLNALVNKINLDKLDKSLGLFFGLAEGFALVVIMLFIINIQPLFNVEKVKAESWYYNSFQQFIDDGSSAIEETIKA